MKRKIGQVLFIILFYTFWVGAFIYGIMTATTLN